MAIAIRDDVLGGVALSRADLDRLSDLEPNLGLPFERSAADFDGDAAVVSRFLLAGQALVDRLPPRPTRSVAELAAADALNQYLREVRTRFLRHHGGTLYARLTNDRREFVRVEDLVYVSAELVPGLVPSRAQVQSDRERKQKDKEGYEVDQGLFLSQVLSHPPSGL